MISYDSQAPICLVCGILTFLLWPKFSFSAFFASLEEQFLTFSIILKSMTILRQFFMLYKTEEAENNTTHYFFPLVPIEDITC